MKLNMICMNVMHETKWDDEFNLKWNENEPR